MTRNTTSSPDYSILEAFQTLIARPRPSLLYQCSLVLVTFAMVLLPLIYLALVGSAAYGVYYHAVHDWRPIMDFGGIGSGRIMILKFIVYVIPLFAGVVIVFFMFKPIFAGRPKRAQPLALNPMDNPLLYAFIEKICETVGAASPKRIDLDCELNASASFRRGLLSMSPNDMVLTIGLPLVANLTAREFAGVVAHEFGHFTQGIGMRLSYVIDTVNIWFARVVYQRDAWDVALEQWSQEAEDGRVAVIIWTTQIGVWLSRVILRILMFTGFFISGFMSRQMEYNADACQIRAVGSEAFEITHRKLATLSAAMEVTYKQIQTTWKKSHQLPDNLSELLRRAHQQLPPVVLKKIDDTLGLHRTGFFDTHPSPADRIRQARKAADPGIFHDDRPASSLFASFEHPARFVTLLHYTDDLGIPISQGMLLHVESGPPELAAAQSVAVTTTETSNQYFLGVLPLLMPLRLPDPVAFADHESDAAELNQIPAGLQHVAEQLAPIAAQYAEASHKLIQARTALRLLKAGVFIQPVEFALTEATVESARAAEAELVATRDGLRHSVREVGAALNRRLQLALSLRLSDRGEFGVDTVSAEQAGQLVSSLNQAADDYAHQQELMDSIAVLDKINALKDARGETPPMSKALAAQNDFVNSLCAPQSSPVAAAEHKPGLQLQVARRQHRVSAGDVRALRQKNLQWFADYGARIEELIQIALPVEGVVV